jgi:hypothetical protein
MKARNAALAGILISLQVITLLISYIIPTIKLALLFAASIYPGVLLRIGISRRTIAVSYLASAALVIFLVQVPEMQAGYALLFGWYALLHESTRQMPFAKQQLIRWAGFILSAGLFYLAVTYILAIETGYALWIIALAGAAAYVMMQAVYELVVREVIKLTKIRLFNGKIKFK